MMMSDNKNKKASMIIASMGDSMRDKPVNDMGDESDSSAGLDAAAQEVMSALDSKDPVALKNAMKSFVSMCMDEYESEPSE